MHQRAEFLDPTLAYWRSNPSVPDAVRRLLTAERAFSAPAHLRAEPLSAWLRALLARYTSVTGELARDPRQAAGGIQTRNPVLWPWCRFLIRAVTYRFGVVEAWSAEAEELADIKVALALFNVLLDDMADTAQDEAVLEVLLGIPANPGAMGSRMIALGRPELAGYAELAMVTWQTCGKRLEALVGRSYQVHALMLERDYERLFAAQRFSCALNHRPREILGLAPVALDARYGASTVSAILAHNANRAIFFDLDLMVLHARAPGVHAALVASGGVERYTQLALLFQDMHQLGNDVATGTRELALDDLSNEIFTLTSELLDRDTEVPLPRPLADLVGGKRPLSLVAAFEHRKRLKEVLRTTRPGSPAHEEARRLHDGLGANVELLTNHVGAVARCFGRWLGCREAASDLLSRCAEDTERAEILEANDLCLVYHLLYQGRI